MENAKDLKAFKFCFLIPTGSEPLIYRPKNPKFGKKLHTFLDDFFLNAWVKRCIVLKVVILNYSTTLNFGVLALVEIDHVAR